MRRFARLTNAFSKKVENHISATVSVLHVLQLLPSSPDIARNSSDGSGNRGPGLGSGRDRRLTRLRG